MHLGQRSQLESCFNTILQEIKDLIEEALAKFEGTNRLKGIVRHVNYVVLSGGLGNSDYVLNELTTFFNDLAKEANTCVGSKIFRAESDAGMVVANGLLNGRGTKAHALGEHIARANYGIIVEDPRSRGSARYPEGPTIRWLVKFGDTIQVGKPITVGITKRLEKSDQGKWTEKIVWLRGAREFLPETVKDGWELGMEELRSVDIEVRQGTKLSSTQTWWGSTVYPNCDFKLMLSVGPSGDCDVEVSENVIKRSE
ncbi:hypothetical protein NCS55_00376100 [Fusarium keratoplasticum]|nr:hypothetical protein NCS55_00376100 [Fusarium keratoplasticum]